MYKTNEFCPICGDGRLKKKVITENFEYKGSYKSIDNYIIYECNSCEESFVDPETLKVTEKVIRDFHREVDGLLTSGEIKEIRVSLGYTQEAFGNLLGGGKKSFARYENGTVSQSRPMDNLLRIVGEFPYVLIKLTDKSLTNATYEPMFVIWDVNRKKTILKYAGVTAGAEIDGITTDFSFPKEFKQNQPFDVSATIVAYQQSDFAGTTA